MITPEVFINPGFNQVPIVVFELGAKKKKNKGKAQSWNKQHSGTSKSTTGHEEYLRKVIKK